MAEKTDVLIDICNAQTMDGETENLEMRVVGTLCETENGFLIEYTEYDAEENCCRTTVETIGGDFVSVTRAGDFGGEMRFETGRRSTSVYSTPYGEIMMGMYTKCVENGLSAAGGRLHFCYTTDFQAMATAENKMTLTLSPAR